MRKILTSSRYLIYIPVVGSLIGAVALLAYGGIEIILIVVKMIQNRAFDAVVNKEILLSIIEVIDLFLMGTAFYIIALGLYELFIDENIKMPTWLEIHDFDALKTKLVGVLIVVLGVIFLGKAIGEKSGLEVLYYGVGIALVIAALSLFIRKKSQNGGE
jgi:uncharacterized membrane protein YqhA